MAWENVVKCLSDRVNATLGALARELFSIGAEPVEGDDLRCDATKADSGLE